MHPKLAKPELKCSVFCDAKKKDKEYPALRQSLIFLFYFFACFALFIVHCNISSTIVDISSYAGKRKLFMMDFACFFFYSGNVTAKRDRDFIMLNACSKRS